MIGILQGSLRWLHELAAGQLDDAIVQIPFARKLINTIKNAIN